MERWEYAIECCRSALAICTKEEVFYQRLMIYNQCLGRKSDAISVYHMCRGILSANGINPSQGTQAIYDSIIKD
ncbi:bacterial transcriptional activator domain-containing protein [Candidatus Magnetominusculus dajiuhuensis]|uniref:bacterial transcriptional activator domain-containing protein n=1 Tax=Candidatus Magnetominusculus dajiuhuensis TaxID=3137712 RepID=UPI003B434622